jgi:hypothetical protein
MYSLQQQYSTAGQFLLQMYCWWCMCWLSILNSFFKRAGLAQAFTS